MLVNAAPLVSAATFSSVEGNAATTNCARQSAV
jgi:hypothetical protein